MYPRNAASPGRLYLGPVVQISDGAVQTSGVAVTVTPFGGSETASAGTVAYSTKGGVWYTPTQAETDYTSFVVEASKTGCIPAGVVVVTTASNVSGYVGLDWSKVNAPTTTLGLTGTTIATSQVVASVSGAVGSVTGLTVANLDAAVSSRMASYTQPTGFLAATFPGTVASTTNITAASGVTLSAAGSASMTEGYRADGATGTLAQLLYEIVAHLGESSITSTTKTIKKLDGTTTAATFTLDSATVPTSITRAT